MSAGCSAEFVNSGCMCLADPLDVTTSICGYINKQNGLVYPCDLGCCVPACTNVGPYPIFNEEFRPSGGGKLPPGFGKNLPQSDEPSLTKDASVLPEIAETPDDKVWQIFLKGFVILVIILLALLALKAMSHS